MKLDDFKKNFNGPITHELTLFFEINDKLGFENYSQGFGLYRDNKSGISSWSENQDFLDRLMPFAQANGSGSMYVLWDDGKNKPLSELPVVVFGDEGGYHIVARKITELMQLLTFDSEITVDHEEVYFYKEEDDYEESESLTEYKNWLKENFNLDPVKNEEDTISIIEAAQEEYKEIFDLWISGYYAED
ncbi:hypothetical protein GJU43_03500 [Flavobacterium sp. LC2016-23]|uniref:hypothetical protein n=1 Tax=Flavobacterium sp. LC2016-23 TaxID=2666330 RepID=UPI0012B158E0|nr:hypothetical protein [Flavobacterium sp. LC2016-23]MRX38326.1 hypothetical protein [Flavobacterium sp. LC2016-23]